MRNVEWDERTEGLILLGRALYGERWQAPVADIIGVSPTMLGLLVKGKRNLTEELYATIVRAVPILEGKLRGDIQERLWLLKTAKQKLCIDPIDIVEDEKAAILNLT